MLVKGVRGVKLTTAYHLFAVIKSMTKESRVTRTMHRKRVFSFSICSNTVRNIWNHKKSHTDPTKLGNVSNIYHSALRFAANTCYANFNTTLQVNVLRSMSNLVDRTILWSINFILYQYISLISEVFTLDNSLLKSGVKQINRFVFSNSQ